MLPVAREWVEGDFIRENGSEYVEFGEKVEIKSREWPKLKQEMIENFETSEQQLKRFQQNEEGDLEDLEKWARKP